MYQILQKFFKTGSIKLQVHVCMFNLFTVGKSSSLRALSVHQKMRSLASICCYFTLKPAQYMNTGKNVNHSLHWYTYQQGWWSPLSTQQLQCGHVAIVCDVRHVPDLFIRLVSFLKQKKPLKPLSKASLWIFNFWSVILVSFSLL